MDISYFGPFGRAWNRMKIALFKPFDLNKWFLLGFTAFLAGLADWHNGTVTSRWSDRGSFREFVDFPNRAWQWLNHHPLLFMAIVFGAMIIMAVLVIILWLSSRGSFLFLDNVVRDKAEISVPWKRFKTLGNSLFVWRLVFGLIGLSLSILFSVIFFITAAHYFEDRGDFPLPIILAVGMALFFLLIVIIIAYILLFLRDFVVPIMYKNNIKTAPAWHMFLSVFGRHPFHFILYGLLVFVLIIAFVIAVVFAGLITCCIGWFLLVIPYIGTVITLPVWYFFRAFSLEFLAQFGPEYELFVRPESPSGSTPA
ncbi:MAG: hypothetical protein NTV82_16790 [Candidatus Aminicenantes bacterium]|jgi:hypothetical protein|nr:hypothetical protein [Candidatus Aminicenantes bacterium]